MVPIGLVLKMAIGGSDKFIRIKDEIEKLKKPKKIFKLNNEQLEALKFLENSKGKFDISVYKAQPVQEKL